MEIRLKFIFEQIGSVPRTVDNFFSKRIAQAVQRDDNFFQTDSPSYSNGWHFFFLERIAQAVQTDDNFLRTDSSTHSSGRQFFFNGYPEPFKWIPNPFKNCKTFFKHRAPVIRGTQRQVSKSICLEDDLRSRIFGNICWKISCLPTSLGIFKHLKNGIHAHYFF